MKVMDMEKFREWLKKLPEKAEADKKMRKWLEENPIKLPEK